MKKYLSILVLVLLIGGFYYRAQADIYGNSLYGYWSLDSNDINWNTGIINDYGSGANNGSQIKFATSSDPVIGKIGQALNFNGSTAYIKVPGTSVWDFGNTTFTVSFWFKTTNNTAGAIVAHGAGATSAGWVIFVNSASAGIVRFLGKTGGGGTSEERSTASTNLNDGKWHFYLAVVTTNTSGTAGQNIDVYVDNKINEGSLTNTAGWTNSTDALGIGARTVPSAPTTFYSGQLDDVRIYNRGLSVGEINQLYYQNLGQHGGL